IPPLLVSLYETFLGIFTGTVRLTFLVVLIIFLTKLLWDIISDWIFKDVKKYLNYLFFPGAFFHQLAHTLVIKLFGHQVRVNFHMSYSLRDISSQSMSGELKNVYQAFLIGIAPLFNFVFVALLIQFHPEFIAFFEYANFNLGNWFIIYLIVCFTYFGMPDFSDLMLPFTTATARHAEIIFLLIVGFFGFVISISLWGWFIPLLNFIIYCIVLIYLAEKEFFTKRNIPIKDGFEPKEDSSDKKPL
ncbi:MAG: hypothetical protein KGD64_14980, partial [Candidatus Heimdallarchaeota archaeon]|nr:hypothetical protein [Candidatus Heimdallarchaeota archaeon]